MITQLAGDNPMTIQSVGIREFRANLTKYTRHGKDPVTITSHGEPIGYFIPVGRSPEEQDFTALLEATRKISSLLEEKGINLDEMLSDFQEARQQNVSA